MTRTRQQSRLLTASVEGLRQDNDLLAKRAFQLGFAKGLLADLIAAAEAPEDVREWFLNYAVARVKRELGENGRLGQ